MSSCHALVARLDRRPESWLILAVALIAASQLRWGIDVLAWISWVPLLRYTRLRHGLLADLAVIVTTMAAMTLAVVKITTAPLSVALAPAFGIPMGLFLGVPTVLFARVRRVAQAHLDPQHHAAVAVLWPTFVVVGEWMQHGLTELATWGAAAHTQLDDLALLQLASVTGLAGVSFVVYLVNAALEHALFTTVQGRSRLGLLAFAGTVLLGVQALGEVRLASFERGSETVRVAAVGTDATFGGLPLPSEAELATIDDGIERRVRLAAAQDVELVVWNEGATLVRPEGRDAFLERWAALADELDVEMVASFIVPVQLAPLRYENVAVTLRPDGTMTDPYLKHHPVPGEPAVPGTGPLPLLDTAAGRVGTAICYDGDFPRLGLRHAANGIDLLALPSSDWRGIDPIHTEMARLRAIEGGYSVLRSTRMGLSAGIDATGRFRATKSAFDTSESVMVVELPRSGSSTIYAHIGDAFVALCALVAGLSLIASVALPHQVLRS